MMQAKHRSIAYPVILIGFLAVVSGTFFLATDVAYALPEYSNRTGEPCATCHVNPGGGGPRTLRGMLWTAEGRPDQVPIIANTLLAPGVTDPLELYTAACAGCHGRRGEGLSATSLTDYYLTEGLIRMMIERGAPSSGMPAFSGQITDEQLEILTAFVLALSEGKIIPPESYPLAELEESCGTTQSHACPSPISRDNHRGN